MTRLASSSTTSSMVMALVSTTVASSAGFMGAMSREASRWSRSALGGEDLLEAGRLASGQQLGKPAAGSFFLTGDQKELAEGVGKDDRALVPALGDRVGDRRRRPAATAPASGGRRGCRRRTWTPPSRRRSGWPW